MLALGDRLEHDARVVLKVERELLSVQEAAVALVKSIGEIPMEERDEGSDASREEVVHELDVMVDTLLVDGVVAATDRDDPGPRDGEAVCCGAEGLEERDIFLGPVVRVAGYGARTPVGNLAGDGTEGVPDGRAAAISFSSTFDLVSTWTGRDVVRRSAKQDSNIGLYSQSSVSLL